jgi:hypothetical protein
MSDYPRLMFKDGEEITVKTPEEEADKRTWGYVCAGEQSVPPSEPPPEPESEPPTYGAADDGTGEGPTEGESNDDTHAKRSKKKK